MGSSRGRKRGKSEGVPLRLATPWDPRSDQALEVESGGGRSAAEVPTTVAQCTNGGWKDFGFPDYGACLVFVLSRPPGRAG
jgi:hypothetical protein